MARVRLTDVAAEAGVSAATVSKYLNGHHGEMSAATRERIAAVVERMGYRPNGVARNLRLERSRTIGVILADIRNPYSSAMLEELSAQAAAAGYTLTCAISGNDSVKEAAAVERLLETGADGSSSTPAGATTTCCARRTAAHRCCCSTATWTRGPAAPTSPPSTW